MYWCSVLANNLCLTVIWKLNILGKKPQRSQGGVQRSLIHTFCNVHVTLKQPRQAAVETKVRFSAYVAHLELHAEHTKLILNIERGGINLECGSSFSVFGGLWVLWISSEGLWIVNYSAQSSEVQNSKHFQQQIGHVKPRYSCFLQCCSGPCLFFIVSNFKLCFPRKGLCFCLYASIFVLILKDSYRS